jgi:phosphate transport system permease protein
MISVPFGLLVAVYITEYGRGPLRLAVRFFVDVMTGIPSIVAGLFIYTFWVVGLHRGFSGFAGAMALAVLMLPIIIRSSEEMLLLVPGELREASYALGISRWRTTMKVVLPTASAGITTGIMLAVARVVGETAPLIFTVFDNPYVNKNPFTGNQGALSLFIFSQAKSAYPAAIDRAWACALSLIIIVMVLYISAQLITRRNTLTR